MRTECVTFTCDSTILIKEPAVSTQTGKPYNKVVPLKTGCGFRRTKLMTKDEISGLFGPKPKNTTATCPKCGKSCSFSIPSTTRAVNKVIFG